MAKIKKSRKKITITFENRRESANFLRAAGFVHIPAALDESGPTPHAPDAPLCSACGLEPVYENDLCWNCLPG